MSKVMSFTRAGIRAEDIPDGHCLDGSRVVDGSSCCFNRNDRYFCRCEEDVVHAVNAGNVRLLDLAYDANGHLMYSFPCSKSREDK